MAEENNAKDMAYSTISTEDITLMAVAARSLAANFDATNSTLDTMAERLTKASTVAKTAATEAAEAELKQQKVKTEIARTAKEAAAAEKIQLDNELKRAKLAEKREKKARAESGLSTLSDDELTDEISKLIESRFVFGGSTEMAKAFFETGAIPASAPGGNPILIDQLRKLRDYHDEYIRRSEDPSTRVKVLKEEKNTRAEIDKKEREAAKEAEKARKAEEKAAEQERKAAEQARKEEERAAEQERKAAEKQQLEEEKAAEQIRKEEERALAERERVLVEEHKIRRALAAEAEKTAEKDAKDAEKQQSDDADVMFDLAARLGLKPSTVNAIKDLMNRVPYLKKAMPAIAKAGKFIVRNAPKIALPIALWALWVKMIKRLIEIGNQLREKYGTAQKDLSALDRTSKNVNTTMGATQKEMTAFSSKTNAMTTALGATGNQIKRILVKFGDWLLKLLPGIEDLVHATAGINRQQATSGTQIDLLGLGMTYGNSYTTASNVEAAAVAYLQRAYGLTADEARNHEDYQNTVQAMTGLVTSGGVNGMFNTSNVQGYGYANQLYTPGVQYTDAYMASLRSLMLSDALSIYQSSGAEGLAEWNNKLGKIQTLVGNMSNSLYSFDEVEQVSAVNLDDLNETVTTIPTDLDSNTDEIIDAEEETRKPIVDQLVDIDDHINNIPSAFELALAPILALLRVIATPVGVTVNVLNNIWATAKSILAKLGIGNESPVTADPDLGRKIQDARDNNPITNPNYGHSIIANSQFAGSAVTNTGTGSIITGRGNSDAVEAGSGIIDVSDLEEKLAKKRSLLASGLEALRELVVATYIADKSSIIGKVQRAIGIDRDTPYNNALYGIDKALKDLPSYSLNDIQTVGLSVYKTRDDMLDAGQLFKSSSELVTMAAAVGTAMAGLGLAGAVGAETVGIGSLASGAGALASVRAFATGGIGTSPVTNATLFENGPEAVIPLTSDLGKTFMADAITKAFGSEDKAISNDQITINIDGPTFLQDERAMNKLATEIGDRYAQVKARRGGI